MPNKVTYTITTVDGKEHQVSKENVDKYGIQSYADAYKGATIRMRDAQKGDYDIPLQHFDNARKQGLHAFSLEHTAPKATPTPTAKPATSPSVPPRQSTPQVSKPLLSDSFGKGADFLKPKPVGYNLSEEHRAEVLGEQAKRSNNPTNPHVQRAAQLGNEAKAKRVKREQNRFGKPTIVKAFDDAIHGDKKAAKELGMPQVMQQKKDEIDYMQATGKELRNPVDAGLTYDENGDVVHSMFAPIVARDEHGNIVTNDAGEPLVGVSTDEARAKAYGDSVQTGVEAKREKDKVDDLYKDAVENVNDAFDEDYKKKEAFKKEHPFLGAVSDALEGFSNRGNALQYVPEEAKAGLSTLGILSKAAVAKNNADRYGDAGTLSRLYGGIMAGLTDPSTYDFGLTDTFNATNLYRAAKNYEEGKATNKDKMLLDAAAIANSVQSEASDKLGGAFGAGQNLVGTLGFMAQMATNPASGVGKDAAASVAKTVAKRALQKFGKGAIAKAVTGLAKGATRVGMDAVEAGVVTGMYSPTKIVGDYLNRKTGDVQSDGKGGYIFQNKEYSDVKALAKAINGQYAENISEMWGEYLPGMGKVNAAIGRGARKIGLGKVVDAFEHMSSSNWAKTWKNFQERTKWNGMAGEYFEEVANNLYNAVTNGDMTLDTDPHTGVFNPKINLDTFYSVALMSGIMSGVNTAGYARERYKAPHEQRKADAQARSVFGERWDEYKDAIDNADEKQIGSVMEKIGSDKSLSNSQKIAALQYQYRTAVVHGVNAQDTKNKLEGQFNAMDEAYSMGYNLQDEKELNNTAILYDEAKKQATKATGWDEDALDRMIGEDGGASTLAYMKRSDEFNDDQLQAFTDYANTRAAYNGMIQRVKDDIDTKVHESNLEVEQRTNLDTGAIHPATMKVDNRQVYIVNGNVVMLPDGSGVDHEHSDDFVVLRDAKTGELETADPSAIFKVDTPINVQEEKETAADNIRQTVAQQQADKIDGKLEFKQGDTYPIIDKEDGTQHSLTIIGDAIDEKTGQVNPDMVLVDIDGAQQPTLLPKEQVQQQVDEARRAAVAATQVVEHAPTDKANNTYDINDEVTLTDENGNTVRGSITAPQNEDGKFEVYTEQPINGKKVNLFSAEELDALNPDAQATEETPQVTNNDTEGAPVQSESEVNLPQNNVETSVSGTESVENSPQAENAPQPSTALERIPTDESGQPLYEQTDPETAWDAIVEQTGGDTSMAQTVADDMVSDLEAGVKKAEKTKTKGGTTIAEKIAAEKERSAAIEQAKQTLAHWRKIAAVNRMREAAIQAEEQRKAEEAVRLRKEQEDKERAEQEEAERIKREALNGVPDFVEDKAPDARARGYRRVNGDKVDRQEPLAAVQGKEVQVKFDDDNIPTGHVAIIEANQLQPSHKNRQRNPQHFIDEAQPKERKDDASVGAARKIAANIRPEEITSSVTAYTGAPTVNSRGEVIQGNNRSAALREMWDNHQEQGDKYKKYLMDNAESFGLRAEDIAAMDKPVLVNMLNVNDEDAIALGQFVASDTESGGTERIKPKNVVKKLGDKMKNFANILLRTNDENISFAELVDSNGVDALKWLNANGIISPTQYKSAFDSKGNITAEAKNDIKGIMYQSIFEGGSTQLEEMFNTMPTKAQKAILATAYRDYDNPKSERMVEEIQNSIMAYYALSHDAQFMAATNHKDARMAVEAWKRQYAIDDNTGESYLPAEKYSNFALLLATMYKGDNQSFIQGTFNKMYDLIQGTQEETLFEQPDNTPRSLVQAIKETLNIEYNGQQRSNVLAGDSSASQEGRTGSNGDATPRGRSENIDGAEANQGGTERESTAEPQPIGQGEFGPIYDQFKGKANEAVEFLLRKKNGEAIAALHHKDIGDIDLVWGKAGTAHSDGFGLAKLSMYHPEVISNLQEILDDMVVTSRTDNRVQLESEKYQATVRLTWDNEKKTWLLTMFEKKNSALSNTTDTDKTHKGNGNDTATPESTVISESKDKQSSDTKQENVDNYLEKPTKSEDLFAMAERVAAEDKAKRTRKKEEAKVDTNPTEAQKEAGNYRKGHIKVDGMDITIEQPKGSVRRGKDVNGKEWETEMHNTYGYIRGTESVDGDHIDIFLSDTPETGNVFVIDQVNKDGSFDEHKVMYGFSDMESAKKAYLSNYEDGWQGLGNITEVSKEEFKKWIDSSKRKTKSFAEYSSVKTEGDVRVEHPIESSERTKPETAELQHSTETLSNDTEAKRLATDTTLSALNKAGIEVVRATDEQAQELLANTQATSLRTPQGTIYGWTVDGKIYLTETGINPDTPIHEYTHLWAEAMMSKNKKGWNSIKALLKETPVWNEVVADPNYSNITNNEDAIASEVLSRISGRENSARMISEAQKVIDEAEGVLEKAKATTMLLNIKKALRNFWEWVGKSVFNIRSFSNIDEVTDKILYDLVNATRLNANKNKSIIGDDNIEIETAERDKQYLEAVQRGDMDTARRLVNEAAERNGYTSNSDYQGTSAFNGAAPYGNGYFFSREKRKEAYENDEFDGDTSLDDYINGGIDPMNLDFLTSDSSYRHADDARKEAIKNLRNVIKNKRQTITMYRSVPSSVKEGSFRNGDWVTPSYTYAVENARVHGWGRDFRIIEQEVPIDEVWFDGNDVAEFGYGNENDFINDKDYLYSNTKNNRKLPDIITYDDNRNIIPLSKRFNKLKGDPRFQIKKDALSANDAARSHAFEKEVNEQRAAEEPLFNVSSSIRSFTEGNLFSEVDFSDSPNKNVNQAISKLTDDELLKEIAKGDSKEWNFYMEEYDRRHNKEFQEAVERYMNSLEDEKTSLDTAYGSYVNVAKNWSNGGYHTTERTLLRAQLDAIEDYVGRKENEQLSSVESEAYHQAKETVRKVGYDLTRLRLRPLEEGEVCHVERRYTESNGFSFTGKEHVESIEDIAYIFKQLETSSVENSFLVLIKDGTPTVLHLSIGSYATTLAPIEQAIVAADAINPDKVLFVHNHPSGNISASKQDMDVQKKIKEVFGGKVMPAIIINTTSGKFGMFSEDGRLEDGNIPLPDEHNNIPINVYQFSQQVFAKDWNPEFAFRVVGPESIAEYVSSHRLGEHKKMSLIILDQAGHITGNVFLPWTKLTDVDSHKNIMQIISYVNQMGGRSAILYGNYELGEDTRDTNKSIFKIKTAFSNSGLHLMDVINIDDSAHDRGAMEEDVEYGKRYLDEEKLIVEKAKADGTYMKAPNGKPTKLNERQWIQVRTQTFKSWFGDWEKAARIEKLRNSKPIKNSSKVVDENGEPMVVYHGTLTNGLRKFSTDFIGSRYSYDEKGFFFISNRRIANDYSISEFNASRRGEVIDAYVSLRNPLVVNSEWCKKNGLGSNVFKDNDVIEFWDNYQSLMIEESERNDGVIITDGETSMVVAFDPNQIKSATENNGNFSTLDDDIRYRSDFVNPNIDEEKLREGYGSYTNGELSFINDPVAKMLGKNNRTEEDHKAFAERERQRMMSRISELADRLHLDNVEVVTDSNGLQGKKAKAKGFYSKSSGKITIVIPNHSSVEDVEKTLLHEAVAHYGLRKLFGEHFETFLDNVYQNVEPEIRRIITSQAANNNWDFRTATEEYLAGLAERTDFERVHYAIWNKIKSLFLKMLHSIGFEGWSATELSDNELRYLLWRSYENMKEPGRYRSILGEAEDIAKQNELKVGNYNQQNTDSSNVAERGILYREDDSNEKKQVNAREKYEQRVNRAMFQTQEALQDSMLALKEAMNAITKAEGKNVNIEDIDGYENAYLGENRLSSVNKAEADAFAHLLFKPMLAEVSKICKNAQERAELVDYMMAKHGLERNAVMRKRAIEDILNNEKLSDAQKSARAGLAEYRDYAGLTALTGKDDVTEAEVDAEVMVSEYENTHDTTNLWDKVNAVNAAILSKSYECGMMDKETYEKISDMYKYYIPLRGFDETTSEEAYAYLLHQNSAFNAPIKVAKGRSSKADDPFANMQSMAESAITQGNRNKLVKQRFFNFVLNHPSDLVSISDMWLKYDDVADEWKPVFPDNFEENDSAEDIEQKLKEFEDKMKKLAEQAPDKYKHGKETANIPYRVVDSRDLRQHQVLVKRGGRDYVLTLNGNPRAAQALNGQTNPDNDTSGAIGAILKAGEMVNRQLSAFYTTRNPDFVVSNFIRDMLFSNSIVWVKENPNYALRFHRNIARCNPAQIKVLLAKHRKGTLDMNNKLEHMFYQFMMNGGETGYANVRDIEQHKNDIRRELKRANGKLSITKAFNLLGEKLDEYNRAVENCARFAAYLTSREMGRTVERSIYDAKEISVNFNKKGSGAKFMNAVGQTKIGTASAFVSGIGRSGFVFWNAAIQGTTNFGRQFKKHPAKAFTASAIMFLLGAVIAGIGMGDGDDDADANSYWNLPEYVRRSNILFKIGDQWVSIPLPVEYRAIYGMGELMVSAMSGKEHFTGSELGKAIAGQATQVLPIDFLEGGGGVKAFVPSAVKPLAEVYSNKGWTGMPIYKDTPYNKYMPEWTKAYKSANKYLVGIAKTLNKATGGDAYTKGSVDINPAQIEYLLNGYFGGVSGTIDKLSKSAETIAGQREYDPKSFLVLNRILKNGDERTEARAINNEYFRVKEEHDVLKARMKHYENDTDKGLFDYADKIDFLYNSPEFARYEIFEDYSKDIDALNEELKEANDGAEHLSIEKELTELKKEMIEEMNKTRK
jgi:putative uncharacterized protein (fragment)